MLFTKDFWLAASVRAIKTLAQTMVALLVAAQSGLIDADWGVTLSVAGMAALVSVLTSVATADNIVPPKDPPPAP